MMEATGHSYQNVAAATRMYRRPLKGWAHSGIKEWTRRAIWWMARRVCFCLLQRLFSTI